MKREKTRYSEVLGVKIVELIDYITTLSSKKTNIKPSTTVVEEETKDIQDETKDIQPKTDPNKSPNGKYLDWENKRMVIKDIWFGISCLGFIVFAIWIAINKDSFNTPYVKYPDGSIYSGNCEDVKAVWRSMQESDGVGLICPTGEPCEKGYNLKYGTIDINILNATLPPYIVTTTTLMECPKTICPEQTNCSACEQINNTCPKQECPPQTPCVCECPYETGLTKVKTNQLVNVMQKMKPNNSPAFSGGCATCLREVWDIVEIPYCAKDATDTRYCQPRFNPAPSTGYYNEIGQGKEQTEDNELYCFVNEGNQFTILRSSYTINNTNITRQRWGWSDSECLGSKLTVRKL
jgi:hypothetical protein